MTYRHDDSDLPPATRSPSYFVAWMAEHSDWAMVLNYPCSIGVVAVGDARIALGIHIVFTLAASAIRLLSIDAPKELRFFVGLAWIGLPPLLAAALVVGP